jgi:integrase
MPGHKRRYQDDRQRFLKEIAPFFATKRVQEITSADIGLFIKKLVNDGRSSATVVHYTGVLRKILKYAADNRLLTSTPNIPRIPGRASAKPRDYFSLEEYKALVKAAEEMAEQKVVVRGYEITLELKYLVQFMVNSFIRPSDLRVLRHKHVKVKTRPDAERPDERNYLELTHPATKTTDKEVVTMPAAYGVYGSLVKLQEQRGYGSDEDFVFFPKYKNRNTMMVYAGKMFQELVRRANIDTAGGDKHTLYSLRHSAIMFRLMLGETDSLTLAKNARTSQAMIDKFYASRLSPSHVVDVLHTFRRREGDD